VCSSDLNYYYYGGSYGDAKTGQASVGKKSLPRVEARSEIETAEKQARVKREASE
jgi:hypothetical protein